MNTKQIHSGFQYARFSVLLLSFLILSTRLATLLHELFGHAMVAWFSGGVVRKISISLFGGGFVIGEPGSDSFFSYFLFHSSGMAINVLSGLAALFFSRRIVKTHFPLAMFGSVFFLVSLSGTFAYMVSGLFYRFGDPYNMVSNMMNRNMMDITGLLLLPFAPLIAFATVRSYAAFQDIVFPTASVLRRFAFAAGTFGVAVMVYAGMFIVAQQNLGSLDAPKNALERERKLILSEKRMEVYRQFQKSHPDWSTERIVQEVKKMDIDVKLKEVPEKPPFLPILGLLMGLGGVLAFFRTKSDFSVNSVFPENRTLIVSILGAVAIIGLLIFIKNQIFPFPF